MQINKCGYREDPFIILLAPMMVSGGKYLILRKMI